MYSEQDLELVSDYDIAIIGAAGRFPGADDLEQFWQNLTDEKESISWFDKEELISSGLSAQLVNHPDFVRAAPVLNHADQFDARFFGYTPNDAERIDPQQRVLLEIAWHAIEDAGYIPGETDARIATFASTAMNTYLLSTGLHQQFYSDYLPTLLGADKDFQATRIAYKLGLTGPALSVQTACSSSLVGIHLGCQTLISRESDMALVAAAAIRTPLKTGHLFEANSVLSPDGHCRPFDNKASGTIFGSGAGAVLLKRLRDAMEDRDSILGVIKGSAVNNDGSEKADYTAPTVQRQAEAISEALGNADISPESVSYIEAHGTGTFLGDPIEVAALTQAYDANSDRERNCGIGSVKSNIGHLDAAAGMAALLKVLLALRHNQIPATINFQSANTQIEFEKTPFRVISRLQEWQGTPELPLRAGITSLGMGGTNAHIILEQAPETLKSSDYPVAGNPNTPLILKLSARTAESLEVTRQNLATRLETNPSLRLKDVAFTLEQGRSDFAERASVVATNLSQAIDALRSDDPRILLEDSVLSSDIPVCCMFPGQGLQRLGMGIDLYKSNVVFRDSVDQIAELFKPLIGKDIRQIIFAEDDASGENKKLLSETFITQPALFAVEYAYLQVWQDRGLIASSFIGHSIGEYVAAVASGVFSLEAVVKLVAERGRLMQSAVPGSMLAVNLSEAEVSGRLPDTVDISVVNASESVVLGGPTDVIEILRDAFKSEGVRARLLDTSHAFHSRMMEPIVSEFVSYVTAVSPNTPSIPFISNVTGDWITAEQATDPAYWGSHLRNTVRFNAGIETLLRNPSGLFVEMGPGSSLSGLIAQHESRQASHKVVVSLPDESNVSDQVSLEMALAKSWAAGLDVVTGLDASDECRRVSLPGYSFQRERYWYEPDTGRRNIAAPSECNHNGSLLKRESDPAKWFWSEGWKHKVFDCQSGNSACEVVTTSALDYSLLSTCEEITANVHQVDPAESVSACLASMDSDGFSGRVLFVWDHTGCPEMQWFTLLEVVRFLTRFDGRSAVALDVLTKGSLNILQDGVLNADGALATGIVVVVPKEWPHIRTRQIDIDPAADRLSEISSVLKLNPELDSKPCLFGHRLGRYWQQVIEQGDVGNAETPSFFQASTNVTHIVTGAFGGVGQELCLRLAANGGNSAHLILTMRHTQPQIEANVNLSSVAADQLDADNAAFVATLQSLGARVEVVALDITEKFQVQELLSHAGKSGNPARIYHLAGISRDEPLLGKSNDDMRSVLQPKVKATAVLYQAICDAPESELICFASTAAVLGPPGQVDYASANAFQLALSGGIGSRQVRTIAWPGWKDTGMLERIENEEVRRTANQHGLSSSEALDLLETWLASGARSAIISPVDLEIYRSEASSVIAPNADTDAIANENILTPVSGHGAGSPLGTIDRVKLHWKEMLGFKRLADDDDYFDLGGTSLVAVRVCARLEREFDVPLPVETLIAYPTIKKLAQHIDTLIPVDDVEAGSPKQTSRDKTDTAFGKTNTVGSLLNSTLTEQLVSQPNLVLLSAGSSDALPVFLIHSHGGMVIGYQALAKAIGQTRPVIGVQATGVRGDHSPNTTIEAMAREYAEAIDSVQPGGPVVVGGYCMGGTIAWQVAEELRRRNRTIDLLFLVQSFYKDLDYPVVQGGRAVYRSGAPLRRHLELYRDKGIEALTRHHRENKGKAFGALASLVKGSLQRVRRTVGVQANQLNEADSPALMRVHKANGSAFYTYDAPDLDCPVAFYPAAHQPSHVEQDLSLGWKSRAKGWRAITPIPGSFLLGLDGLGHEAIASQIEQDLKNSKQP